MLEKIHIFYRIYLKYYKLVYLTTLCIINKLFLGNLYFLSFYSLIFNLKIYPPYHTVERVNFLSRCNQSLNLRFKFCNSCICFIFDLFCTFICLLHFIFKFGIFFLKFCHFILYYVYR